MVFWDYSTKELWYMKASLEGSFSMAYRIYETIEIAGDTWFTINNSFEIYGVENEMLQSYTAAAIQQIQTDAGFDLDLGVSGFGGVVLPSHPSSKCI